MARRPRVYVEGLAQHVIQRGNNRQACFFSEADYAFYLSKLKEAAECYGVAIHAFVLMTNHVHLLATPSAENALPRMMQALGRSYVRYINITYKRSGTLWEGRYKASLVSSDRYFFTVSRYIEMNPVRAKMVASPGEYPWTSYRHNAMGIDISMITPSSLYRDLGATKSKRIMRYRELFEDEFSEISVETITAFTDREWVIGNRKFVEQIELMLARRINSTPWGGDRKSMAHKSRSLILDRTP